MTCPWITEGLGMQLVVEASVAAAKEKTESVAAHTRNHCLQ